MASEIDVINSALTQLGELEITARTDSSRAANLADRTFDELRQHVLRDHPWNFSTKRASLAALSTAPEWGFDYAYRLPSDNLRLLEIYNPNKYEWKVEQVDGAPAILTNIAAPLDIRYIADITDASQWDAHFRATLAARCMVDWAQPLTGDASKLTNAEALYRSLVRSGKAVDGQEGSAEIITSDSWILARL